MWDVVCVTCPNKELALELHKELLLFQKKGLIYKGAQLLVVEDPRSNVGSGGATFNAILTVAELLSAKNDYAVINVNCLKAARILVLHMGHRFELDIAGRACMTLPCVYTSGTVTSLLPNFIHTYLMITNHVAVNSPPGVWVSSTDMISSVSDKFYQHIDWASPLDMLGLAVPMPINYVADRHGMYIATEDGLLADLIYRPTMEQLTKIAPNGQKVLTLVGIVYLRPWVVESILSFYEVYPLNACTYVGVDSGIDPINLSLFMDVMRAAAKNLTEQDFIGDTPEPVCRARSVIYKTLHKCIYRIAVDNSGRFLYPDLRNSAGSLLDCFLQFVNIPMGSLSEIQKSLVCHSFLEGKCNASSFFISSYVGVDVSVDASSVVSHSIIEAPRVAIGRRCIVNGLVVSPENLNEPLAIPDEIVLHQYSIKLPTTQLLPSSVAANIVFGLHDSITQPVCEATATFCNIPWQDYLAMKGIEEADLWPSSEPVSNRSVFTARLYPVLSKANSLHLIMWLASKATSNHPHAKWQNQASLETWRSAWRFSISDLVDLVSYPATFENRHRCYARVAAKLIERQLANSSETNLFSLYNTAAIDGFAHDLLTAIDEVALQCMDDIKLARLFANIAALLGCMSGGRGGVRSGPAGNVTWRAAYSLLRNGDYERAVRAMATLRSEWLSSPQLIIRAARHYEGAQGCLVAKASSTAMSFVYLRPGAPIIPSGRWIVVETPCRVDFAGAWADTPPVCYEIGGAVSGAAIVIKGKNPIGCKVRKVNQPSIIAGYLDELGQIIAQWTFDSIEQLSDFNSPFSQAALIKACLVCAGVIIPSSSASVDQMTSLADQLMSTVGAPGLEIYTWSNLPQGSGLGTSSILAGAFISALWSMRGFSFDASSVIHAVLHFEQLLTTGGGWQDQIHGLVGGVKLGYSAAGLPLNIRWRQLHLDQKILDSLNKRLLLVYSGQTRLAKNILQNVLRNWYSNDPLIVSTERDLARAAQKTAEYLEAGNFQQFAATVTRSHELKKRMAPGSETETYCALMKALKTITDGYSMCGAGGGGFIYFLLKDEEKGRDEAKRIMKETPGLEGCVIYDSKVSTEGMTTKFVD